MQDIYYWDIKMLLYTSEPCCAQFTSGLFSMRLNVLSIYFRTFVFPFLIASLHTSVRHPWSVKSEVGYPDWFSTRCRRSDYCGNAIRDLRERRVCLYRERRRKREKEGRRTNRQKEEKSKGADEGVDTTSWRRASISISRVFLLRSADLCTFSLSFSVEYHQRDTFTATDNVLYT